MDSHVDPSIFISSTASPVGWSMTLGELALRMRCPECGKKAAEAVAVARAD
jgi:hypothetical protein